ncbi:hypothetical protein ABEX35_02360 [Priestia megaterium]|uniref:hypothetical protein n=1 Tax=Priestia megaterium TaxID=1404 RepID=UPI000BF5F6A1|nr:hypothetical protein [Priestia megaterium]PFJ98207.1 hypothetical protein COI96_20860 [Priestia megaterium]PMD11388.1 hypothetical protein CJ194_07870 [Priestia megaterium]
MIKSNRIKLIIGVIIYIFLLNVSYIYLISPNFSYFGYIYIKPSNLTIIIGFIFAIIPASFLRYELERPSEIIHWILYIMVYIPTMFIPNYTINHYVDNQFILFQIFLLASLVIIVITSKIRLLKIPKIQMRFKNYIIIMTVISIIFYSIIIYTFGLNFKLVSLNEVYDVREMYRSQVNRFAGYAINWQSKIVNTLFIGLGVIEKNLLFVVLGFIGQLFIFSTTGQKSVLFSFLLIIGILISLKNKGKKFGLTIVYGFIVLILITSAVDIMNSTASLTSLFIRRMIVTPGLLTGYFYDFFSSHPKVFLSQSIINPFMDYPYKDLPPFLIGEHYFGKPNMAANANLWADAFANFGLIGLLIFSFVLGIIMWIYDSLSTDSSFLVSCLLISMTAWSLTDTALFTSLLTHGILFALIINFIKPIKLRK